MTRTRYLEAQNESLTNHGKFLLVGFDSTDGAVQSEVANAPLIASLPVARRFGPILRDSVWLLDLQTQEGMLFSPSWAEGALLRRFLCHPIHVCVLYWPTMRYLNVNAHEVWTLPQVITLPDDAVIPQAGLILGMDGKPVTRMSEWMPRKPLAARYRNRAQELGDPDGQAILTPEELATLKEEAPTW